MTADQILFVVAGCLLGFGARGMVQAYIDEVHDRPHRM